MLGTIYAFTADGLSFRQPRDYAERTRREIMKIPAVGRVELLGVQDEVIYLDFSTCQIGGLGIDQQAVLQSLQAQNAACAVQRDAGWAAQRVSLRVSGQLPSEESLRAINIRVGDRFFRLSDVVTITRGYAEPAQSMFRYNGQPAIGLAIGMKPNGNLARFGEDLRVKRMREFVADLADRRRRAPSSVSVNQPAVAGRSGRRLRQGAGRGGDHRARRELPRPRPAAPGWWWRFPPCWCWRAPSCSWSIPASPCSASRSAR